jgi:hypothetical protein
MEGLGSEDIEQKEKGRGRRVASGRRRGGGTHLMSSACAISASASAAFIAAFWAACISHQVLAWSI